MYCTGVLLTTNNPVHSREPPGRPRELAVCVYKKLIIFILRRRNKRIQAD
jgi:hypothetical protein